MPHFFERVAARPRLRNDRWLRTATNSTITSSDARISAQRRQPSRRADTPFGFAAVCASLSHSGSFLSTRTPSGIDLRHGESVDLVAHVDHAVADHRHVLVVLTLTITCTPRCFSSPVASAVARSASASCSALRRGEVLRRPPSASSSSRRQPAAAETPPAARTDRRRPPFDNSGDFHLALVELQQRGLQRRLGFDSLPLAALSPRHGDATGRRDGPSRQSSRRPIASPPDRAILHVNHAHQHDRQHADQHRLAARQAKLASIALVSSATAILLGRLRGVGFFAAQAEINDERCCHRILARVAFSR